MYCLQFTVIVTNTVYCIVGNSHGARSTLSQSRWHYTLSHLLKLLNKLWQLQCDCVNNIVIDTCDRHNSTVTQMTRLEWIKRPHIIEYVTQAGLGKFSAHSHRIARSRYLAISRQLYTMQ